MAAISRHNNQHEQKIVNEVLAGAKKLVSDNGEDDAKEYARTIFHERHDKFLQAVKDKKIGDDYAKPYGWLFKTVDHLYSKAESPDDETRKYSLLQLTALALIYLEYEKKEVDEFGNLHADLLSPVLFDDCVKKYYIKTCNLIDIEFTTQPLSDKKTHKHAHRILLEAKKWIDSDNNTNTKENFKAVYGSFYRICSLMHRTAVALEKESTFDEKPYLWFSQTALGLADELKTKKTNINALKLLILYKLYFEMLDISKEFGISRDLLPELPSVGLMKHAKQIYETAEHLVESENKFYAN